MRRKTFLPLLILLFVSLVLITTPLHATAENDDKDAGTATNTLNEGNETAENSGGLIALTFDDGPSDPTDELLDGLKERGVKVTFFIVGSRVDKYPDIILREYEEGHELACHTWSHTKLTTLDAAAIQDEITHTRTDINNAIGTDIGDMILRPPGGNYNDTVKSSVGAPLILWSVDTEDWRYRDAETVKNNIIANVRDGSIVLLHDLYATSVEGALAAIDELQEQGYTFVTVSELFRRKGISLENGVVYRKAPDDGIDFGPLPEEESKATTYENENENSDSDKKETDDSVFPWGLLIFCIIILLINAAGMLKLFWGCKPQRKVMNDEKNASDDDSDGGGDTDDSDAQYADQRDGNEYNNRE
jgi:peptidoglycan/xylan/chitin deacetylase (PgdA/CDA1 family)